MVQHPLSDAAYSLESSNTFLLAEDAVINPEILSAFLKENDNFMHFFNEQYRRNYAEAAGARDDQRQGMQALGAEK
jgi:hypothetical protein